MKTYSISWIFLYISLLHLKDGSCQLDEGIERLDKAVIELPHNMKPSLSVEEYAARSSQYPFSPPKGPATRPFARPTVTKIAQQGGYSPAPQPPPSYDGNGPVPAYPGPAPNSGYPGPAPNPGYPVPAPNPGYPGPAPSPYAGPDPGYPGPAPDPGYPGPAPDPGYPGPAPDPAYPGPAPDPGYPGPAPDPGYPGPDPGYPGPTPPYQPVYSTPGYPGPDPGYPTPGTPSATPTVPTTTKKTTSESTTRTTTEETTTPTTPTITESTTTPSTTTPTTTESTTESTTPSTTGETTTRSTTTESTTTTTRETTTEPTTTMSTGPTGSNVPNRIRGKPHIICEDDGIVFNAKFFFGFIGEIFARDRKSDPNCYASFDGTMTNISIRFPYKECGRKINGAKPGESMYAVEVIVSYEQPDGESTIQSYLLRCLNQRIRYETEEIPRRIEEALEELNLIPIKVEKKAKIPKCLMRIVPESEEEAHHYGPSAKDAIQSSIIGQKLRIEWSLDPPSEAYGFLVKNCTVKDHLSGAEYLVIDERGCSTDINILAHPHYDTYHDLAIVHWHAFKVPDNAQLSISCGFTICSEIEDDEGTNNCAEIPTPPFCPSVVTAPANTLLFDFESNFVAKRKLDELKVEADICIIEGKDVPEYCKERERQLFPLSGVTVSSKPAKRTNNNLSRKVCLSRLMFSALLGFTVLFFLLSLGIFFACSAGRARRRQPLVNPSHVDICNGSQSGSLANTYYDTLSERQRPDTRWNSR